MVILLQLINHVDGNYQMVSTFQGWRFQHWRQASLWTAKKIRRQRIRGMTRRSESNARGACRIIGADSTSSFCTIENHGNDSKTRKLGLELKSRDVKRQFFSCEQLIQRQQRKGFLHRIVTGDEKWIFLGTTPRRKSTTLSPVNHCHRSQHQHHGRTFMIRRLCSVSGGTKRILFTMNCWNLAISLRAIGIGYNWFVWAEHCEKNGRNSKDMIKLFFFMATLSLMSLKS